MEIKRTQGMLTLTTELTPKELEQAYRERLQQYRMEDAKRYAETFCDLNGFDPEYLFADDVQEKGFYELAVMRHDERAENDIPDATVWTDLIEDMVDTYLKPSWAREFVDFLHASDSVSADDVVAFIREGKFTGHETLSTQSLPAYVISKDVELYAILALMKRFVWEEGECDG